jgi:high-affinity nickel-transport protein
VSDLWSLLGIGFLLGMRHATDADHVVAVTTIVSRERSLRAAMTMGALWGLGHTVTILGVGGAIVLFGLVIPPRLGLSMEMSVAVMLVILGALNLTGALRDVAHHRGAHRHDDAPEKTASRMDAAQVARPLVVGVVHGLAGSAAVALLVLATIHDANWALVYLGVFGFGTVLGMICLTALMSRPLAKATEWSHTAELTLVRLTGFVSLSFGLFLAYRIGVHDGLFVGTPSWSPR